MKRRLFPVVILVTILLSTRQPVIAETMFTDENWIGISGIMPGAGWVKAIAPDDFGNLYIGGVFYLAGETNFPNNRHYIAKWNGSTWSTLGLLGSGASADVNALAILGGNIYAGGTFTNAGDIIVNRIGKWNGDLWSPLGSGMDGSVSALATSGSDLYAGGAFVNAGGVVANRIAKWNGSSWSALGSGLNGSVFALAVSGSNLYVGGGFTAAGGIAANLIAEWDGSEWSSLGSGMNGPVEALAIMGADLYAGGSFTNAGGNKARFIAKWNGSSWSALDFLSGPVNALAVSGGDLYATGSFHGAGTNLVNLIAKWGGSEWSPLGSGLTGEYPRPDVYALALSGNDLYTAGTFSIAGGKESTFVAKANIGELALPGRFEDLIYSPADGFSCTFLGATIGQPYRIQVSPSLSPASWMDFTNFSYTAPVVITGVSAGSGTNKFFRAITP